MQLLTNGYEARRTISTLIGADSRKYDGTHEGILKIKGVEGPHWNDRDSAPDTIVCQERHLDSNIIYRNVCQSLTDLHQDKRVRRLPANRYAVRDCTAAGLLTTFML